MIPEALILGFMVWLMFSPYKKPNRTHRYRGGNDGNDGNDGIIPKL